jgi:hypothetical protein
VSQTAIPPQWEATIAACLAKDLPQRPQSAAEVAQRLGLTIPKYGNATPATSPTVSTAAPSAVTTAPKPTSRTLTVIAAVVVLALVGGAFGWYFGVYAPNEAARKAEKARIAAQRSEAEAAEAKAKAAAEHLATVRGAVLINTEPQGATVTLGDETQKSPASFNQVKVGSLPFKVTLENYEPVEQQLEVKEGQIANPGMIKLVRSTGSAQIDTTPEGIEFDLEDADGKHHAGKTPAKLEDLPAGTAKVTYKPEKSAAHTESVAVAAHQNSAFAWKVTAAASPSPASAAAGSPKPTATPESKRSFAGTWTGTVNDKYSDGSGATSNYTIRIPTDEKTVWFNWSTSKGPGQKASCDRDGDTLTWSFRQEPSGALPGEWTARCTLKLNGNGTASFLRTTKLVRGRLKGVTGKHTGTLSR